MIFNKGRKLLRTPFHYNNEKLENVRKFKYLGFLITPSGEIMSGLNDLRDRALKGFYKLKNAMGDYFRANIRITIHLFDSLIKPILMYMNDFWGGLPAIKEKCNPIEKLHYMVCKQILGVQKQTTNTGVLLELGRIPLQNFAIKAAIKNWERIKEGNVNEILKNSHMDAISNKLSWITNIKFILQSHNIDTVRLNRSRAKHPFIHKIVHLKQCESFHNQAFESIQNQESKLRTYSLFKTDVGCERYLHEITNMKIRQSLTKFRLSNNSLNIEKLRHTTPKTPKEQRFCPFCPKEVEDEVHFLIQCPTYQFPRFDMVQNIDKAHLFSQTPKEQFIELMNHENAQIVTKTVNKLFELRDFLVNKPKRPI